MRISLQSAGKKILILSVLLVAALIYIATAAKIYLAAHFAGKNDQVGLQRAIRLDAKNAEYHYLLGRYLWLVQQSADAAIEPYRAAVSLNPHEARYWFDLAGVYQFLGNTDEQRDALEHAIREDPNTPAVAWEAANFYAVQGDTNRALKEYRVVMQNDPYLPPAALQLCWRIEPDIDALLRDVVPAMPRVYSSFLEILISKKEPAAAAKVWARMAQLDQPIEKHYVFDYIRYLVGLRDVDQARVVWQQAAKLSQLSAYQPTSENLVVNGDFSLEVLNGGFDWIYHGTPEVSLALDPTEAHSGNHSLRIIFDSRGIEDAGIRQLVVVQPNTEYEFSGNFKSQDVEGAGGPRFAVQDLYSGTMYFTSDDLKDADFWKSVHGEFKTGPDTKLLVVRIQRFPIRNAIKGKLWIDGIRLVPKDNSQGGNS